MIHFRILNKNGRSNGSIFTTKKCDETQKTHNIVCVDINNH